MAVTGAGTEAGSVQGYSSHTAYVQGLSRPGLGADVKDNRSSGGGQQPQRGDGQMPQHPLLHSLQLLHSPGNTSQDALTQQQV
jgi:hypothetical protein